jgi:hypothetical protein
MKIVGWLEVLQRKEIKDILGLTGGYKPPDDTPILLRIIMYAGGGHWRYLAGAPGGFCRGNGLGCYRAATNSRCRGDTGKGRQSLRNWYCWINCRGNRKTLTLTVR